MKEIFSINDVSVLNPEVLIEQEMAHSLIFLGQKIWELLWISIKNSGLLTTFQSAIRLKTVFKTA